MQLNRALGRLRLVRPRRVQLSTAAWMQSPSYMHRRWVNTRQTKSLMDQVPNKIENKLEKVLGDKSAEAARAGGSGYTGDQFTDNKGPFSSSYSTPSSSSPSSSSSLSSSSSSDANKSSSSSNSGRSSSFGSMGGSPSSEKASNYDRLASDRSGDDKSSRANLASEDGGSQSSTSGRSSSYSSSSGGSRAADDRFSAESGYTESRSKTGGGGSFGDSVNKMADKVSDTFSGSGSLGGMASKVADKVSNTFSGSGSLSGMANKVADKVSDTFSGSNSSSRNSDSSSGKGVLPDNSQLSSATNDYGRSSNDYNRTSNDYNRTSDDRYSGSEPSSSSSYSGDKHYEGGSSSRSSSADRSYGGGSSSRSGSSSSTGTLGDAFNKMSDKISEGSSTIGQTLHKISDKISETFSGSGQSENQSSEGGLSSSQGKMMRTRRNRRDSSSLNPFDLSSFFRGNFLDNLSETFSGQALSMKTDIIERDSEYRVICDLPGVDKKDINITLRKNYLEINGERSEGYDQESSDQTVHCQERYFGSFTRRLSLPDDAAKDMSRIKAKCENGVLSVTIPKSQQSSSSSRDRYNINIE